MEAVPSSSLLNSAKPSKLPALAHSNSPSFSPSSQLQELVSDEFAPVAQPAAFGRPEYW